MLKAGKKNIISIIQKSNYTEINSKAAEMSFYLLLSFFPFLIFTISSIVYIPIIHLNKYVKLLENIMPASAFNLVSSIIQSAIENRSFSFLVMSFVLTLWTLSRGVKALIKCMNKSYRVRETRTLIKVSFIAFLFTIILLLLIFSSMIFLVYGERIGYFIFKLIGLNKIFIKVWNICRYSIGITTIIIILISLYTYTPNKRIQIKEATPGAFVATFAWLLVSFVYSYYANHYANYEIIYGSIGGIIALLTWLYLSSWALLIGSEVNAKLYFRSNKREKTF
ncbi:YihY/virulence factor BrkB family protein [Romboutsia sp.]|uniref:YihY/virulence factor BrkB family protein n=1 Tax=Romboutsia sp. TaxID=1965302 RepID=UPI003F3C3C3C